MINDWLNLKKLLSLEWMLSTLKYTRLSFFYDKSFFMMNFIDVKIFKSISGENEEFVVGYKLPSYRQRISGNFSSILLGATSHF